MVVCMSFCFGVKGQSSNQTPAVHNKQQVATLKTYPQVSFCGVMAFAAAYIFSGENDSTFIGIIRCPEMNGEDFFKKGDKYRLILSNINIGDSLKGYIIINRYYRENHPVYIITVIKKLN